MPTTLNPVTKRLAKNFSIGVFGTLILATTGLIQTALLTKNLTIDQFGQVLIVVSFYAFILELLTIRSSELLYKYAPILENKKDYTALKEMFFLCFGAALIIGLLLCGTLLYLAPVVAAKVYHDPTLTIPFKIYALAIPLLAFENFCTAILRVYDRFAYVVAPQVISGLSTALGILAYILYAKHPTIIVIVSILAVAGVIRTAPLILLTWRLIKEKTSNQPFSWRLHQLRPYRKDITSVLLHTNLVTGLKIPVEAGALFMLSIFSSAKEVAYYGLILRLLSPFVRLAQKNLVAATFPEVTSLYAEQRFSFLHFQVKRFVKYSILGSLIATPILFLIAKPAILIIAGEEYVAALPVFYFRVSALMLTFSFLAYYPLSLSMGMFHIRNYVLLFRLLLLAGFVYFKLTATTIAAVEFIGAIALRLFHDQFVHQRLLELKTGEKTEASQHE